MRGVLPAAGSLLLLVACAGDSKSAPAAATAATPEELAAEVAVVRAGCVRCHAAAGELASRLAAEPGPALAESVAWHADDGGAAYLRTHHGGDDAPDLAAWLLSLAGDRPALRAAVSSPGVIARGEQLFGELACQACHAPADLVDLPRRTDHAHVAAFLCDPAPRRPGLVHDFGLEGRTANSLAAWLLRAQLTAQPTTPQPGFAYECFELHIDDASLPVLDGLQPAAQGVATNIDAEVGTREDHFALRFTATLDVPASGEWTFTCRSDDSSWLWIDEQLVVRNEGIAPRHDKRGSVRLDAGPHDLRVVFTEAAGGQSLEVLWRGPGVRQEPIPATRATATSAALAPPAPLPTPDAAAVARGRAAAAARRCASCHAIDDAQLAALPASKTPPAWSDLGGGDCPQVAGAPALLQMARRAMTKPREAASELLVAMRADGCSACHSRDGRDGLSAPAAQALTAVEDLGDEGRLPPDLTAVGHRLRPAWLEKVLAEGYKARPYLAVRMPKVGRARARQYAQWFAAVDGRPGDDDEPEFSLAAAQLGQQLVGTTGRNCVTCHSFAGKKALGPQGMDLGVQHARLRPAWFRQWLLQPAQLRPGTRMPSLWPQVDDDARRDVDAIRSWLALGVAAPLPAGLLGEGATLELEPTERPRLHGAFLRGLSARCVAVGTRLRTHYAYDIEHARLAWLWRGAFVDAKGTWSGRAGQLLDPLGQDWVVLDDLGVADAAAGSAASGSTRSVLGHRIDGDGYPIWRVAVGTAELEDAIQPRLVQGGSEIVRTLHVVKGALRVDIAPTSGSARLELVPADLRQLQAGQNLEIVYRW